MPRNTLYVPLAELREKKGWTIDQLARISGLGRMTIIRLEQQRTRGIDFETLDRLAKVLDVEDPGSLIVRKRYPKRRET
jgi:transcriptional regulator with XRE-family HTH domain